MSGLVGGYWGVSYGFTNDLTLGVSYQPAIRIPDGGPGKPGQGPMVGQLAYAYLMQGDWELVVTAAAGYQFDLQQAAPVTVGSIVSWMPLLWLTVMSPGNQFSFGLASPNEITFSLPTLVGVQLWTRWYLSLSTNFLTIPLRDPQDEGVTFIGRDNLPVAPSVMFSPSNQWGITAGASFDAVAPGQETVGNTLLWSIGFTFFGNVPKALPLPPTSTAF